MANFKARECHGKAFSLVGNDAHNANRPYLEVRKSAKFASSGVVAGAEGPEVGSEGPPWAASGMQPTASIRFIHQSSVAVMKRTAPAELPAEQGDLEISMRKAHLLP